MNKDELEKKISDGNIKSVIDELIENSEITGDNRNILLVISGEFQELVRKEISNILGEEEIVLARNSIRNRLLNLIEVIEKLENKKKIVLFKKNSKNINMLIFLLTLLIIMLVAYLFKNDKITIIDCPDGSKRVIQNDNFIDGILESKQINKNLILKSINSISSDISTDELIKFENDFALRVIKFRYEYEIFKSNPCSTKNYNSYENFIMKIENMETELETLNEKIKKLSKSNGIGGNDSKEIERLIRIYINKYQNEIQFK